MAAKARAPKKKAVRKASKPPNAEMWEQAAAMAAGTAKYPISLDFRYGRFVFSGHSEGGGSPKDDNFSITVHGTVREYSYPLGAIRFSRKRWKKFKKLGNRLMRSLPAPAKKKRKNK